jgi:signal transduction histidine kinase
MRRLESPHGDVMCRPGRRVGSGLSGYAGIMPGTAVPDASRRADGVDPRLVDGVLAAAMTVVVAVVATADMEGTGRAGALSYLFAAGFGVLVLARRHTPRLVLVLTVLGIFVYYAVQLPPIGIALPAVAALYSAAEADCTRSAIAAGAVLVSVAGYARVEEGVPAAYLFSYDLLTDIALVAAAIALGVSVRSRRETRAHQEQVRVLVAAEERREADRRRQAERVGIARDLHDTIGHTMSVIAVHSNVAAEAVGTTRRPWPRRSSRSGPPPPPPCGN